MKTFVIFALFCAVLVLSGCALNKKENVVPAVVPPSQKTDTAHKTNLKIIGAVEPIYILPMKASFAARVDTGAAISSLDATDIKKFERDGEKWISFKVKNRKTGEENVFEKPLVHHTRIKRVHLQERRPVVSLDVKFGGQNLKADFTLIDRKDFDYQVLIGRNILNGRAVVDPSRSMTLK